MTGLRIAGQTIAGSPWPRRELRAAVLILADAAERHGLSGEDVAQVLREVADAFDV